MVTINPAEVRIGLKGLSAKHSALSTLSELTIQDTKVQYTPYQAVIPSSHQYQEKTGPGFLAIKSTHLKFLISYWELKHLFESKDATRSELAQASASVIR